MTFLSCNFDSLMLLKLGLVNNRVKEMEGKSRREIYRRSWKTIFVICELVPSSPGGGPCRGLVDFEGLVEEEKH